jgi:hypothetical protein
MLRYSAKEGVMPKATSKWSAPQKDGVSTRHNAIATVQALTVANNLQSYRVSQRNRMKKAMELAEKLGYTSAGTMIEFINSGTMNNLPVTETERRRLMVHRSL